MSNCRLLNSEKKQKLNAWLTHNNIQLSNRNCRDLSNVKNMAKLFRKLNPKLVDAHQYVSHSTLALKLSAWENFNLLVLRKLGLTVSRTVLEKLASGERGAIKYLLFKLMCAELDRIKEITESWGSMTDIGNAFKSRVGLSGFLSKDEKQKSQESIIYPWPWKTLEPPTKYQILKYESDQMDNIIELLRLNIKHIKEATLLKEDYIQSLLKQVAEAYVKLISLDISLRHKKPK